MHVISDFTLIFRYLYSRYTFGEIKDNRSNCLDVQIFTKTQTQYGAVCRGFSYGCLNENLHPVGYCSCAEDCYPTSDPHDVIQTKSCWACIPLLYRQHWTWMDCCSKLLHRLDFHVPLRTRLEHPFSSHHHHIA